MKKLIIWIAFALLSVNCLAKDIRTLFIDMPDSIIPLLTKSNRMDCLDYLDSGMKAEVTNILGGRSSMTMLGKNHLKVKVSMVSDFDMKLFYHKDSTVVICVVYTVSSELSDSRLSFYDSEWNLIPSNQLISEPKFEDFISNNYLKNDSISELKEIAVLRLTEIKVDEEYNGIRFAFSSASNISKDASEFVKFINTDPISYNWTGKIFRKEKSLSKKRK